MPAHGATLPRTRSRPAVADGAMWTTPQRCGGHVEERQCARLGTRHGAASKSGENKTMYLLLAAHPDGAALQELTADGLPSPGNPHPRIISRTAATAVPENPRTKRRTGLAAVVRELEKRRPRWIWHRTQDWYPALLAGRRGAGALLRSRAVRRHPGPFGVHRPYPLRAKRGEADAGRRPPAAPAGASAAARRPPTRGHSSTIRACSRAAAYPRGAARRVRRPAGGPGRPRARTATAGSGSSCFSPPSPPGP